VITGWIASISEIPVIRGTFFFKKNPFGKPQAEVDFACVYNSSFKMSLKNLNIFPFNPIYLHPLGRVGSKNVSNKIYSI